MFAIGFCPCKAFPLFSAFAKEGRTHNIVAQVGLFTGYAASVSSLQSLKDENVVKRPQAQALATKL